MSDKDTANKGALETVSKLVQVLSVVAGATISIISFNDARNKEAEARKVEAQKLEIQRSDELYRRQIEAAKSFLDLRQRRYTETLAAAAVLASPERHSADDIKQARRRFRELYWAEMSMVEASEVERAMVNLAKLIDPDSASPTPQQRATYELAHAVRDSLLQSWGIDNKTTGRLNQ